MRYYNRAIRFSFFAIMLVIMCGYSSPLRAQVKEPDVRAIDSPKTPLQKGYTHRFGAGVLINNFGAGISGIYGRVLGSYTEVTVSVAITGIRDASEQTFTDYFTGRRLVPNKYNRALGFPLLVGLKKRIFPRQVADNFRFFVAASAGPALALVSPYIDDQDGNGFRTFRQYVQVQQNPDYYLPSQRSGEPKKGFFSALGESSTKWGAAGQIRVGVDLGSNLKHQSTLEVGYFFYYFDQGIQILSPRRAVLDNEGLPQSDGNGGLKSEHFFDSQKFFGTPQIRFTFSGWW